MAKTLVTAPFYPIIYVRGYAMTQSEIADTVATPYMGFNLGATKIRQAWDGKISKLVFESPLLRLMKDYGYTDTYRDGRDCDGTIPARSVIIYRYYEPADPDLGDGQTPSVTEAADGLCKLILQTRDQVCGKDPAARKAFKVYLVAHSMGGLVCRSFLQNKKVGSDEARALVDKVFTYATPHNGIEMAGINVPGFMSLFDMNNFNHGKMREFLGLPDNSEVDSLNGSFDAQRFFCLVGTNSHDYAVAAGLSRSLAGTLSDGLVRIENAAVRGAPRALVHRSHSGHFGIVNSEEGYQNLVRFLFGDMRVDGLLDVAALPLPPEVKKAKDSGKTVRGSYYFECSVSPRGGATFDLTRRTVANNSAILRQYDELFKPQEAGLNKPRNPRLFSCFLDTSRIAAGNSVVFSVSVAVSSTDFVIDGFLWMDKTIPGEYLFRDNLVLQATPPAKKGDQWTVRYTWTDDAWSQGGANGQLAQKQGDAYLIPMESTKGFKATLRLNVSRWT